MSPETYARHAQQNVRQVELSHGELGILRATQKEDHVALAGLYLGLNEEARYTRFFSHTSDSNVIKYSQKLSSFEQPEHIADIVIARPGGSLAAHAILALSKTENALAEAAMVVANEEQGRGLGPKLMVELIKRAKAHNIRLLEASVLPRNRPMIKALDKAVLRLGAQGLVKSGYEDGTYEWSLDVASMPDAIVACASDGLGRLVESECPKVVRPHVLAHLALVNS